MAIASFSSMSSSTPTPTPKATTKPLSPSNRRGVIAVAVVFALMLTWVIGFWISFCLLEWIKKRKRRVIDAQRERERFERERLADERYHRMRIARDRKNAKASRRVPRAGAGSGVVVVRSDEDGVAIGSLNAEIRRNKSEVVVPAVTSVQNGDGNTDRKGEEVEMRDTTKV